MAFNLRKAMPYNLLSVLGIAIVPNINQLGQKVQFVQNIQPMQSQDQAAISKRYLASSQQPADPAVLQTQIDAAVADYVRQRGQVGLVVGVIQDGQQVVRGYSSFSAARPEPPDAETIFEIGSITKLLTGITLAQLGSTEVVALDGSIQTYLPADVRLPPAVGSITLRQLASHTSGLPRLPDNLWENADLANPYANYSDRDLYEALSQISLTQTPGTQSVYSNFGMGLLGHLLALQSGKPYEALIEETICQPLGLEDTTITLSPEQQQRLIAGHSPDGEQAPNWEFDVLAPAGAFRSTASDLLRFLQAGLQAEHNSSHQGLASAIARSQTAQFQAGNAAVGLGWQILAMPDGSTFHWHNGGTGGYISFIGMDRQHQTGVVILSNYGDAIAGDFSVDRMGIELLITVSRSLE